MFSIRNLLVFPSRSCYQITNRCFTNRNLLTLTDRLMIQDIFPENAGTAMTNLLIGRPQTIYAGFDPTANSLHIGNLLIVMGLLHSQRSGHQPIALLGGATGIIGDPSGRKTERKQIENEKLLDNLTLIQSQIERIFVNHSTLFWERRSEKGELKPIIILNNSEWYKDVKLIDYISTIGRYFRLGTLLSRSIVQSRLKDEGMSFTEFTYQLFQANDWLHLYEKYNCLFQLGGSDQMGNLMSGQELISRVKNKQVYGITLPIITNEEGDKFGKSAGNAIWLDAEQTTPFSMYQYFVRQTDADVERLLKMLTFLPLNEIDDLMAKHRRTPELRLAQTRLADEVTLLVHGESGLESARNVTQALYKGSPETLGRLSHKEISDVLTGATTCELLLAAGMTILDVAMKANFFPTEADAKRIINAGGFYVNQSRAQNTSEVISPSVHILQNGLTLFRVGKRNFYIVKWKQ